MRPLLQRLTGKRAPAPVAPSRDDFVPFDGWNEGRLAIPVVDALTDDQLRELNTMLDWHCFVVDSHGRRFGTPSAPDKRVHPQDWPDYRVVELHKRFGLADKTVLEIGCFEGILTSALCSMARQVKACDARVSNVAKTVIRCAMFQTLPQVFVWDVERPAPPGIDLACDILYHQGVLYHLVDPVRHLASLLPHVRDGLLLDTHVAEASELDSEYTAEGRIWRCKNFTEGPVHNPFAGMYAMARWLLVEDLEALLRESGFSHIDVAERRNERNGMRILLFARR